MTVKTRVEPAGSVLLYVSNDPVEARKPQVSTGGTPLQSDDSVRIARHRDNVLLIDFIDLQNGDKQYKDIYYNNAGAEVFRNAGLSGNPWFWAMQYKQDIVNMDLSAAPGLRPPTVFTVSGTGVDTKSMKILVERPWLYTVKKVNGTPAGRRRLAAGRRVQVDPGRKIRAFRREWLSNWSPQKRPSIPNWAPSMCWAI